MKTFMPAMLAAALIATPVLAAQTITTTQTTSVRAMETAAPAPVQPPTPLPGISRTYTPPAQPGGLNEETREERPYVLIWPDWESPYETPANFNR